MNFSYDEAFSRNIGWITEWEQLALKNKKVAIAGMGGVGGVHLLTLARLGIGAFNISDLDKFELANFNRQIGATLSTIGQPKVDVLADMALDINPDLDITKFGDGVDESNIDAFLDGVDLFIDGFDFFVLDVRAKVFQRCHELGIPCITAAPLGMGTAFLVFMPDGMSFEEYFRLEGLPTEKQYVNFFMGLVPKGLQRTYLMDPRRMDLEGKRGPSSVTACQMCAGVTGVEAVKILLDRGNIKAAPHYHQFDAYRGKWVSRRLIGGNRNPLQRLKLKMAYKGFAALSRNSYQPPYRETGTEIEQILDVARWAPSGDNNQPWRFEIIDADRVRIYVDVDPEADVYDYNNGQPTLLSAGFLIETIKIAASAHGRAVWWTYGGVTDNRHTIEVELTKAPGIVEDALFPYVPLRSVNRRPFRTTSLTRDQRQALGEALGDQLEIRWHETFKDRWRIAKVNGLATDIRLRIPEAFRVHKRILDWDRPNTSPTGVPVNAIGLDKGTLKIMRWAMHDWKRMDRMNRMPGGTLAARLQMDYLPGLACAGHFSIVRKDAADGDLGAADFIKMGQSLQRFWLTATKLGLDLQPSLAPLCFADYARRQIDFTDDPNIRELAAGLAGKIDALRHNGAGELIFLGRIGLPRSRNVGSRSVRRPLEELLVVPETEASAPVEENIATLVANKA